MIIKIRRYINIKIIKKEKTTLEQWPNSNKGKIRLSAIVVIMTSAKFLKNSKNRNNLCFY